MLHTLLLIILVLVLLGALPPVGLHQQGWSPAGVVLIIIVLLLLFGGRLQL